MDPQARRAWRGDRELELTRTEFELLELLIRNAGVVLEHSTIYDRIWGYDFGPGSKNLAVYVGYLRRKLDEPGAPQLIHTVRGVGYVLREGWWPSAAGRTGRRLRVTGCGCCRWAPPSRWRSRR